MHGDKLVISSGAKIPSTEITPGLYRLVTAGERELMVALIGRRYFRGAICFGANKYSYFKFKRALKTGERRAFMLNPSFSSNLTVDELFNRCRIYSEASARAFFADLDAYKIKGSAVFSQLSTGQRAIVQIYLCMLLKPDIIALDTLLDSLSLNNKEKVLRRLKLSSSVVLIFACSYLPGDITTISDFFIKATSEPSLADVTHPAYPRIKSRSSHPIFLAITLTIFFVLGGISAFMLSNLKNTVEENYQRIKTGTIEKESPIVQEFNDNFMLSQIQNININSIEMELGLNYSIDRGRIKELNLKEDEAIITSAVLSSFISEAEMKVFFSKLSLNVISISPSEERFIYVERSTFDRLQKGLDSVGNIYSTVDPHLEYYDTDGNLITPDNSSYYIPLGSHLDLSCLPKQGWHLGGYYRSSESTDIILYGENLSKEFFRIEGSMYSYRYLIGKECKDVSNFVQIELDSYLGAKKSLILLASIIPVGYIITAGVVIYVAKKISHLEVAS